MRQLPQLNWIAVLVIVVLGTGGFLLGHWAWTRTMVSGPLESALKTHPAVRSVEVEQEPGRWTVVVEVDRAEYWPGVHRDLHSKGRGVLGDRPLVLEVTDGRDAELEDAYRAIHLQLHEALATGRFGALSGIEAGPGVSLILEVDGEWLYIQMESEGAYLYEALERQRGGESPW